mmetsp:Transcript_47924/g.133604  ORF Transcript_47924/g.133604 Transcript_47924/m.133604 type:complete len:407 (+) Transcript_47924:768-1988(+)
MLRYLLGEHAREVLAIRLGNEAVVENSQTLVGPEADELLLIFDEIRAPLRDALEDLGKVAQIKRVVGLHWGWQEILGDRLVHVDCRDNHGRRDGLHAAAEALAQHPVEDRAKDALERLAVERHEIDDIEMPDIPLRDAGPTTTRRAHRSNELRVDDLAVLVLVTVVPTCVVHPLPQDLDRRLRAILLLGRHVQIIDEDDAGLVQRRAENPLTTLVELAVDDVLRRVRRGLRRKVDADRHPRVVRAVQKLVVLHRNALAGAGVASAEHVEPVREQLGNEPLRPDRVDGGHDDAGERSVFRDAKAGRRVDPIEPLGLLHVEAEVVYERPLGRRHDGLALLVHIVTVLRQEIKVGLVLGHVVSQQSAKVDVEFDAPIGVDACASGPDDTLDERTLEHFGKVGRETVWRL